MVPQKLFRAFASLEAKALFGVCMAILQIMRGCLDVFKCFGGKNYECFKKTE
ncbi:protein of unknown function [Ruminococcaceae bacterium BL-4]|nr:protein of unknown function [Ruminococcaceae bacterium BL-4]